MENRSVFVIHRRNDPPGTFYSTHGAFGGVEDAVGYGDMQNARKFLSSEEAQSYIDRNLPEWARELHCPEEVYPWELTFSSPELAGLLRICEVEIPHHLLEPVYGRLLIWRR